MEQTVLMVDLLRIVATNLDGAGVTEVVELTSLMEILEMLEYMQVRHLLMTKYLLFMPILCLQSLNCGSKQTQERELMQQLLDNQEFTRQQAYLLLI